MTDYIALIRKYIASGDSILGFGIIFIIALIIIPLPGGFLDALIAVSLFSSILILLTSLSITKPADFSSFPTLLLITTIYRIALNISTTRLILTKGPAADSALIDAFGSFVIGGGGGTFSLVVGIIIFLILTLVQVIVITRGATRVSEVAARFALDSMPGKQMAIDADLSAGYIDEAEARRRRLALQQEMNFYGAMDGASKFVQGDVRLGLVITAINIIGGMIIGLTIQNLSFNEALEVYTRFTIGDGLVSQIPALLISTATGVVVARSSGEDSLPQELQKQLFSNANLLYLTGFFLILAGLIPGFPMITLFLLGGGLIYLAYRMERAIKLQKEKEIQEIQKQKAEEERKPETYLEHLKSEPLEIEVGYNLIPLVDPKSGGTLLDQISRLRRRYAMDLGLIVPPVRIRDNMNLEPDEYAIRLHGSLISTAKVEPEKLLAIDTGKTKGPIPNAVEIREPTYQLRSYWIEPSRKNEAEDLGYDVVDPSTVIATHLSSIIQQNSHEILGRQEIKNILDKVREDNSVIVDEILNEKKIGLDIIQQVFQNLLRENVSIKNVVKILEAISTNWEKVARDPFLLTEAVRQSIRRQIVSEYVDQTKTLKAIIIHPDLDQKLREGIHKDPDEGFILALNPEFQIRLQQLLAREYQKANKDNVYPVFITSRTTRAGLFYILERLFPTKNFAVIAHEEIPPEIKLERYSDISLEHFESELV
ncbi:MAG: flagellar biosynthesis protein FlhA [Leptospiraceae bacterium]|nr:flagellar biosynthesis protein FlhA [Leptospiraceae bacterium]MDW7976493.1 flagellar biosynthesis protein FlhA [Leptospiraceae bacterium]